MLKFKSLEFWRVGNVLGTIISTRPAHQISVTALAGPIFLYVYGVIFLSFKLNYDDSFRIIFDAYGSFCSETLLVHAH